MKQKERGEAEDEEQDIDEESEETEEHEEAGATVESLSRRREHLAWHVEREALHS